MMEYNLSKHSVGVCNRFLDTVNEQIVDVDITLPDYCPDIEKILKCTLEAQVYSRKISGGQLSVEGVSVVRILYCDSIRYNIRSFEQSVPFTSTFNLKSTPEQYIVLVDTKCEYINCRALSPRKLVVHGAFSLYTKVFSRSTNEFFSFDEDCDLQTKLKEVTVSDMCSLAQEQFSISEDITITSNDTVEALLTYSVTPNITDIKNLNNKVMLSADLTLKAMYLSDLDNSKIEHLTYVFPINRVIDCDGVMDDTINIPKLEVLSSDLRIRNDSMNDGSLLSLDTKLCFSQIGYVQKSIKTIDDVYSTEYMVESKRSVINCETEHRCLDFTHMVKSTLKLDSIKISKVADIFCEGLNISAMISDKKVSFCGKTNVCMLIEDAQNVPTYVERSVEIDVKPQVDGSFDRVQMNFCKVNGISFRLVDDSTVEVKIELKISITLCDLLSLNPVTYVKSLEEKKILSDSSSLVLYFADKGENVWDISKTYFTKESLLMSENSLENEVLEKSLMLLIPT